MYEPAHNHGPFIGIFQKTWLSVMLLIISNSCSLLLLILPCNEDRQPCEPIGAACCDAATAGTKHINFKLKRQPDNHHIVN
jgi:hypothetical protein